MTDLSTQSDSCEVAFNRFHDAIVLYQAERYSMSLYMSGFVIEIGTKYMLTELSKLQLSDLTVEYIIKTIDYLGGEKMKPLPKDIRGLIDPVNKLATNKIPINQTAVKALLEKKYQPKSNSKEKEDGKKFHDNRGFLKQLLEWYKVFDHEKVDSLELFYNSPEFLELYPDPENIKPGIVKWGTELRYDISQQDHQKSAEKHLRLSETFLLTVLKYDRHKIDAIKTDSLESKLSIDK